jgi:hypothetical protein
VAFFAQFVPAIKRMWHRDAAPGNVLVKRFWQEVSFFCCKRPFTSTGKPKHNKAVLGKS